MLRIVQIFFLVMSLFLSACKLDHAVSDEADNLPSSVSAKIDDVVNLHGAWKSGDAMTVFGNTDSETYVYNSSDKLFHQNFVNKNLTATDCYYAVFPASHASMEAPGKFQIVIPETQSYKESSVLSDANIMVAVSESPSDNSLAFHSSVGYVKVILRGVGKVLSLTLKGNDGEVISGPAELKAEKSSIPELTMTGNGKSIKLDCGNASASATEFFFCVPDMSFQKGLTVTVKTQTGEIVETESNPVKVTRGRVTELNFGGTGTSFTRFALRTSTGQQFESLDLIGSEITVCVPYGTDLTRLTPVFSHNGKNVEMKGEVVMSSQQPVDFSTSKEFTVISVDGEKTSYTVSAVDFDIPVVYVSTPNHTPIADKETWIAESTFIIQNEDGSFVDYGSASIKGRGNASWKRPKKSYGIKLAVKPKDKGVLGLPGHKRWCMIAVQWGYLGNSVGYELARRAVSYKWQPHARYVEFVLNGQHLGTYLLVEQIRIDDNRVNIKRLKPEDVSEDKISGGYLITYDHTFNDLNKFRTKDYKMPVMIKDPDDDDLVPAQFDWIKNYIAELEDALKDEARFQRQEYANYLDIDTYIDTWFVWEIAGVTGSYNGADFAAPASVWFYKDRGGILTSGPCWDFDSYLFSSQKLYCNKGQYYGRLFQHPAFRARVKEKWPEFRASVEGRGRFATPITEYIDSCHNVLRHSAPRNEKMWTWTMFKYDEEYNTIRNGLPAKIEWLEKQIEAL